MVACASLAGLCLSLWYLAGVSPSETETIDQLLPEREVAPLRRMQRLFSTQDDVMLVLLTDRRRRPESSRIAEVERAVAAVEGVAATWSAVSRPRIVLNHDDDLELLPPGPADEHFGGAEIFLPPAAPRTAVILTVLDSRAARLDFARELVRDLDRVTRQAARRTETIRVVGSPAVRVASWEAARDDGARVLPLLVIVVIGLPLVFFRSVLAPAFPLALAGMSAAATLVLYRLAGGTLHSWILVLVPLVWSVATMDAIHLYDAVRRLSAAGEPDPVSQATRELRGPCLVTMLGTIGSLAVFALPPSPPLLRTFGLWGAVGAAVSYGLTFVVGASLLRLAASAKHRPSWPTRLVRRSMLWSRKRRWHVLGSWALVVAVSAVQIRDLRVSSRFPHVFAPSDPIEQDQRAASATLDTDLSPLDLYVESTSSRGAQPGALLAATVGLGRYLETLPEMRASLSVGLLVDELFETDRRARSVLARAWSTTGLGDQARALARDPRLRRWVRLEDGVARIQVLFSPMSYGRREEILDWLRHYDRTMMSHHRIRFGGSGYVYHAAEREGVRGLAIGAAAEILLLVAILAFALGRSRLVAVALVGNVLPVVVLAGAMAAFGVPWSLGLLGLPVVVLGLAVDDTVHVLWPLRGPCRRDVGTGLLRSARHSGAAILATTAVLAFCLSTLSVSRFQVNRELGLLFPLGLGIAALAELTLVPALLRVWPRRSARRPP